MWVFIWALLSSFILGIFFWSLRVLWFQKRAWSAFSKKYNFEYTVGKFNDPPLMKGVIEGHTVALFTDARQTDDVRGQRYVTVIEVELVIKIPTGAALSSAALAPYLQQLSFEDSYVPQDGAWGKGHLIRCRDKTILQDYLTPERQKLLHNMFSMKNADVLLIFDEKDAVLRIETSDPLCKTEKIEKMVKQFVAAADKLTVKGKMAPTKEGPVKEMIDQDSKGEE